MNKTIEIKGLVEQQYAMENTYYINTDKIIFMRYVPESESKKSDGLLKICMTDGYVIYTREPLESIRLAMEGR